MPTDTQSALELDDTLAGLDALDLVEAPRTPRLRRAFAAAWPKLAATALAIGAWQALAWSEWKPRFALAWPEDAWTALGDMVADGTLAKAVGITLGRAALGFGVALVIGVVLGALVVRSKLLRAAFGSLITGVQTMPSVAWVPLAILLFQGDIERSIQFVMILGAAPAIANGLIAGSDQIPPILLRAGRVLGARGFATYRHIILPAALPSFVGGLKQGWAFLWRSLMAAELIAAVPGSPSVGFLLNLNRQLADSGALIAVMIVILLIGVLVDSVVFGTLDRAIRRRWGLAEGTA